MKKLLIPLVLLISCNGFKTDLRGFAAGIVTPIRYLVTPCPDCLETGCIYQQINGAVIGEGTDGEIMDAVYRVCKSRSITDTISIKNLLSNYYL